MTDRMTARATVLAEATIVVLAAVADPRSGADPMARMLSVYVAGLDHGLSLAVTDIAAARRLLDHMWAGVPTTPESDTRDRDEPVRRLLEAIES